MYACVILSWNCVITFSNVPVLALRFSLCLLVSGIALTPPACGGCGTIVGTAFVLSSLLLSATTIACQSTSSPMPTGPFRFRGQHLGIWLSGHRPSPVFFLDHQHCLQVKERWWLLSGAYCCRDRPVPLFPRSVRQIYTILSSSTFTLMDRKASFDVFTSLI